MAAAPARFTFDLDLGRGDEPSRGPSAGAMEAMLAEARQAGFAEGFAAGEQGVLAQTARHLDSAAAELGDRVSAMAAALDDTRKATLAEAVGLAASIARKLASGLVAAQPTREIEELVAECLATLEGVPHLVIRCNAELADRVRGIATDRIQTSGFSGRLVVLGDPEIPLGDCRLEWVDGGLVRDQAAIDAQIDSRIENFLAARGISNGAGAGETT